MKDGNSSWAQLPSLQLFLWAVCLAEVVWPVILSVLPWTDLALVPESLTCQWIYCCGVYEQSLYCCQWQRC